MENKNYRLRLPKIAAVTLAVLLALPVFVNAQYKVGDKAADFNIKDINGRRYSLSGYRGNVVILNFFASW